MAQIYFPNRNPIGRRIAFGLPPDNGGAARDIVGVVGDVRDVALGDAPGPMMYVPFAQSPLWGAGASSSGAPWIRRASQPQFDGQVARIDKICP